MEELNSRRWNPGFVVMRWRHLFCLMPLLGLLAGLAWAWMEEFKEISLSGSLGYWGGGTSTLSDQQMAIEGVAFMTSNRVLERASFRLARDKPWWMHANVASLRARQTVELDPAVGAPVVKMTFTGRGKKATEEIWMAIYNASNEIGLEDEQARALARLHSAKEKVLRLEEELAALEQSSVSPGSLGSFSTSSRDAGNGDNNEAVLSKLADARKEQERVEMSQMGCMPFGGVDLISPPSTPTLGAPFGPMGMLGLHGAFGFGVGAILAVCLAYALESLKPRGPDVTV